MNKCGTCISAAGNTEMNDVLKLKREGRGDRRVSRFFFAPFVSSPF